MKADGRVFGRGEENWVDDVNFRAAGGGGRAAKIWAASYHRAIRRAGVDRDISGRCAAAATHPLPAPPTTPHHLPLHLPPPTPLHAAHGAGGYLRKSGNIKRNNARQ